MLMYMLLAVKSGVVTGRRFEWSRQEGDRPALGSCLTSLAAHLHP